MNRSAASSEPPEEPLLRSEPNVLSPASPKPFLFPQPTSIPILEMQMDVDFNQTELHMSDPSTRNTELRPDAWRDPNEQPPVQMSDDSTSNQQVDSDSLTVPLADHVGPQTPIHELSAMSNTGHAIPVSFVDGASHATESGPAAGPEAVQSSTEAQPSQSDLDGHAVSPTAPTADTNPPPPEVVNVQALSEPSSADVDVNSLLDSLQTSLAPEPVAVSAPSASGLTVATTAAPSEPEQHGAGAAISDQRDVVAPILGQQPTGLPPRPPPQEQPNFHPNYDPSQHIRTFHPHAGNPAHPTHGRSGSTNTALDGTPPSLVNVSQNADASLSNVTGDVSATSLQSPTSALSTQTAARPISTSASSSNAAPITPIESRRESKLAAGEIPGPDDRPWDADIQRKYDRFLEEERKYVNEARWDQFPAGSRLFVGNLSSEKVTKRDIYHVFHSYGDLAQISIKQAYGFVQFLKVDDCNRAMEGEQGRQIREKRIHLEVSKPQKSKGGQQQQQNSRRSRSPEYNNRGRGGNVDRYVSGSGGGRGSNGRGRDEYRSNYRSPSPRGYRERFDDRYRARSRSPGYDRGDRYSGRDATRDTDDDLPLPRRPPQDVPDVQIIVLTELSRDFIAWVEQHFTARNVRVGTLRLAPRLSEEAVVRRQIMEGVLATVKLTRKNQDSSKIGLTIFKRKGGMRDVQFEEYENLDPNICVELVLREKQTQASASGGSGGYAVGQYSAPVPPPPQPYGYQAPSIPPPAQQPPPPYGYPPSGYGQPYSVPAPPAFPPNLQNINTNNLQSLLTSLSQNSPGGPGSAGAAYGLPAQQPGSAGYPPPPNFGQYPPPPPQQQHHHQRQSSQQDMYAALRGNPAGSPPQQQQSGAQPGGGGQGQPPVPPPNMQDILARLGTYGSR